MKLSFLYKYEQKTRILTKTNTLMITESRKIWRITLIIKTQQSKALNASESRKYL